MMLQQGEKDCRQHFLLEPRLTAGEQLREAADATSEASVERHTGGMEHGCGGLQGLVS